MYALAPAVAVALVLLASVPAAAFTCLSYSTPGPPGGEGDTSFIVNAGTFPHEDLFCWSNVISFVDASGDTRYVISMDGFSQADLDSLADRNVVIDSISTCDAFLASLNSNAAANATVRGRQ
ncbi:hypothetical protein FOA52_007791 [Chlamydomonas sp. UWO 241]|nr:hypothetical protein FOA52_007791 [Chlamydomonas sp. UWO 241]